MSQFADANEGNLSDCDCVFLCDVPRFSLAEVRRLDDVVLLRYALSDRFRMDGAGRANSE
jgi:hypothetical protein